MAETVAEAKVEPVSWDEQQYKTALAHLERLDNQVSPPLPPALQLSTLHLLILFSHR